MSGSDGPAPEDLVVGTIHLPRPTRPVPWAAWAFIALAVLVFAVRLSREGLLQQEGGIDAVAVLLVLARSAAQALLVALPAAVLIGRPGSASADRAFLAGSILLAAAVVGRTAWSLVAGFLFETAPELLVEDADAGGGPAVLGFVVPVGLLVASLIGAVYLAIGFGRARTDAPAEAGRTLRLAIVVVGSVAAIGGLLIDTRLVPSVAGFGGPGLVEVVLDLLEAALVLAWTAAAWAVLVGRSSVDPPRRGWSLAATGVALVVVAEAVGAVALAFVWIDQAAIFNGQTDASSGFVAATTATYAAATLLRVAGLGLLFAGLARPLEASSRVA